MIDIFLTYLGARSMRSLKSGESNKTTSRGKQKENLRQRETETENEIESQKEEKKRDGRRRGTCQRTSQGDRIVRLLYDTASVMALPQRRPMEMPIQSRKPVFTSFSRKNFTSPSSESLMPIDFSMPKSPFSTAMNTERRCSKSERMRCKAAPKSSIV